MSSFPTVITGLFSILYATIRINSTYSYFFIESYELNCLMGLKIKQIIAQCKEEKAPLSNNKTNALKLFNNI